MGWIMKAFKVCVVTGGEEFISDMRVEICAANNADLAKAKYDSVLGDRVVKVVDVTKSYTIDLSVVRDALNRCMESNAFSFDLIAVILSVLEESYDNVFLSF